MEAIKRFFSKFACCGSDMRVELKQEKTEMERRECSGNRNFLISEGLKPYEIHGSQVYMTKHTFKLAKAALVNTLFPHHYINEKYEDIFPEVADNSNILPEKTCNKPTLVLDLDHTLVYPSLTKPQDYDFSITVTYNNKIHRMYFVKRPGLEEFLSELNEHYELVLYTAGIMQYALKALKNIDPDTRIKYCLSRSYCTILTKNGISKDVYVKNLDILGRDLTKTIVVDDKTSSYIMHPENGQHIPGFFGSKDDTCLYKLKEYLLALKDIADFKQREKCTYDE